MSYFSGMKKAFLVLSNWSIGKYLLKSNYLLLERHKYKMFFIPGPLAEAHYLIIKKAMKRALPISQKRRLQCLFNKHKDSLEKTLEMHIGTQNLLRVRKLIESELKDESKLLTRLSRSLLINYYSNRPHLLIVRCFFLIKKFIHRIFEPTGLIVAILSPDGGGKSALSEAIRGRLRQGFRGVRSIHWRPYLLPPPRKLLTPSTWHDSESPNYSPHSLSAKSKVNSIFRFWYYLADYFLGFFPKMLWPKIRTNLVISERYYYDFCIDTARFRLDIPHYLPWLFLPVVPRPDLLICLCGPPEVIYARKQEISFEEIIRQLHVTSCISKKLPYSHQISIDQPFNDEVSQVEDFIMGLLEKRLRKRVGRE